MPRPRSYVQKWLLEIRFQPRPSMFWLGGELADRWIKDFPDLEVTMPNYRLVNKAEFRNVQFGYNNAVLDIEGVKDIDAFIKLSQRLATDVVDIVHPDEIVRLGMRQITLLSVPSSARSLAEMIEAFGPQKARWDTNGTRDQISDVGIVLNFKSQNVDGVVQFGPYVDGVNNVQNFIYSDHPELKSFRNGYIFNCDYGEHNLGLDSLEETNIADWIRNASIVARERIEKLRQYIYPSASLE